MEEDYDQFGIPDHRFDLGPEGQIHPAEVVQSYPEFDRRRAAPSPRYPDDSNPTSSLSHVERALDGSLYPPELYPSNGYQDDQSGLREKTRDNAHNDNYAQQTSIVQHWRTKAVVRSRPHSPTLEEIVAKRAKKSLEDNPARILPNTKSTSKPSTISELESQLKEHVATMTGNNKTPPLKPIKPRFEVRLTSPEFATPNKPPPKPHWRLNPLLKNAKWYTRVTSRPITTEPRLPRYVLATIDLMQNVHLVTALRKEEFRILDEDRSTLTGVDLALSPTTGILFRPLAGLAKSLTALLADLDISTNHYTRVIVILEVKSYGIKNLDPDNIPTDDADPHTPETYGALEDFVQAIAERNEEQAKGGGAMGVIKLAFALNGAGEAARVVRAMSDHPEQDFVFPDPDGRWLDREVVCFLSIKYS